MSAGPSVDTVLGDASKGSREVSFRAAPASGMLPCLESDGEMGYKSPPPPASTLPREGPEDARGGVLLLRACGALPWWCAAAFASAMAVLVRVPRGRYVMKQLWSRPRWTHWVHGAVPLQRFFASRQKLQASAAR